MTLHAAVDFGRVCVSLERRAECPSRAPANLSQNRPTTMTTEAPDGPASPTPTTVIAPRSGWELINLRELLQYRDLFYFMVKRDIKARYAQTILGFGWAVLRPVTTALLFSGVFGALAKIPSDGVPYPLFSYVGLLPWTYFSSSLGTATTSLVGNQMITKVYFPRMVVPMSSVLSNLVDLGIAMLLVVPMLIYYGITPAPTVLLLPFIVGLMVLTAAGAGMWLSALAVQYRDVKFASAFLISLLMYAAPVAWPASLVPDEYRLLYGLYPIAGAVEGFRAVIIRSTPVPWDLLAAGTVGALILFVSGMLYFRRREHLYADVF